MTSATYHHGDLPNALKNAAAEVIAERGAAGFSLREVARRAGVSHAAPAHHFGDTTGLLTALAVDAFRYLDQAMASAVDGIDDPSERLCRIGRAYVEVGLSHPAHCSVVFRPDLVDVTDPAYVEHGDLAYQHLEDALVAVRDAYNRDLDVDLAAKLCWATMQGLIVLYDGMAGRDTTHGRVPPTIGQLGADFSSLVLDGLRHATR